MMRAIVAAAAACLCLGACSTVGMMPRQVGRQVEHHRPHIREHATVTIGAPASAAQVDRDITTAAVEEGVPPAIAHAVASKESDKNPHARGGIMQVLPGTARAVGESARTYWGQLRAGMKYLRQALALRAGDLCAKISAYNRGLHAPLKCTAYGRKVLERAGQ